MEVVDRDGTTIFGAPAVVLTLSRLPLTAWFALPALLHPGVSRARRTGRDRIAAPVAAESPMGER
jgi:hypothetical protein